MGKFIFVFVFLAAFSVVGAQSSEPPSDLPHRVYGEVTSDDISTSGLNVSFRNSTNYTVVSGNISSQSFYDLYLSGLGSGEDFYLFLGGENTTEYVNFSQGASEGLNCHLDADSYTCVDDSSSSDGSNDGGGNDNSGSGSTDDGSIGGGSGGSGGGGFSGGGFAPVPEDEPVEISTELVNGEADVLVGEVEEDQLVEITVSGSNYLKGFSFTAGESGNVSVNLEVHEEMPGNYGTIEGDVFRYFLVEIEGIDAFTNTSLAYQVPESWLIERNFSVENISADLSQGASWQSIETRLVADSLSMNSFEAVSGNSDGLFAVKVPSQESPKSDQEPKTRELSVQGLSVTPSEDGENAEVTAMVVNNHQSRVNDSLTLTKNGENLQSWQISLEPGQTRELSFTSSLDREKSSSFSLGGETARIDIGSSENGGGLPLIWILIGAGAVIVITGLMAYIYFFEYRRASELDDTIRSIEESGQRLNQEMENVRGNVERLRGNLENSENGTHNK